MYLRSSEIRAIRELNTLERENLFPIFRLRPWMSSKQLSRSAETIIEAFDGQSFGCELDLTWPNNGSNRQSVRDFERMRADNTGQAWYDFLELFEAAIPVIRLDCESRHILDAINTEWMIERGFGFRISPDIEHHLPKLLQALGQINHNNFFVIVDAGWSKDLLRQSDWTTRVIKRVLTARDTTNIFVSGSSFPDQFGDFGLGDILEIQEVPFFDQVVASVRLDFNRASIGYSDWATTRPPLDARGGARWVPRIDVPGNTSIIVYRSRVDEDSGETVRDACIRLAQFIVSDPNWPDPPTSWGHYAIDLTASENDFGVYSPQRNTAARINMHICNRVRDLTGAGMAIGEEPFEG